MDIGYFYVSREQELLGMEPVKIGLEHPKWKKCPAIMDSVKNAFVIRAPIGFTLYFEGIDDNGNPLVRRDPSSEMRNEVFNEFIDIKPKEAGSKQDGPLLQLTSGVGFTANEPVIMETFPPFLEYRPDFPAINTVVKYNIYNWLRGLPVGVLWKDLTKPIVVKRGDPLCYVRFETDKNVNLKRIPMTDEMLHTIHANLNMKNFMTGHSRYLMEKAGLLRHKNWF